MTRPSTGLSPRVRGNRTADAAGTLSERSIPACAGEPRYRNPARGPPRVYPRVCGGTGLPMPRALFLKGLSPRVRGNRAIVIPHVARRGSIPACAGEPRGRMTREIHHEVYPRVCGGTVAAIVRRPEVRGLSPRVRGNRNPLSVSHLIGRSIPACAGEPPCAYRSAQTSQVYPRVCGGTKRCAAITAGARGLSPRVRGNPVLSFRPATPKRSIPACAGEPIDGGGAGKGFEVYPRVCGGTITSRYKSGCSTGLSPRVRGNPVKPGNVAAPPRSIPACAGEPAAMDVAAAKVSVYPRVCGGTLGDLTLLLASVGLSPRVRGNLDKCTACGQSRRSIPACAGEPEGIVIRWDRLRGLSPRVRGNLDQLSSSCSATVGSIPACAGEPHSRKRAIFLCHGSIPACAGEPQGCGYLATFG